MGTKFRTTNAMLGLNETPIREQIASPAFPHLEELTIGVDQRGYFDGMDDNQIERLVKKWCRTLKELDIANTTDSRTVDWALIALVENEEYLKLRKLNLNGTGVSLKALTKLLNCCPTLESLNLSSCRALPRGMKRMYHNREDVAGLTKDIAEGKFDPQDAGSDDDR